MQSMTRRQAATIIGVLLVTLTIVSVSSLQRQSQAQADVHLPIAQSDSVGASAMPADSIVSGEHPELGVFAMRAASGVTITGDYTGSDKLGTPDPALVEAMRKQTALTDEELQKLIVTIAGPETAGSTITIADKEVKLPPNVYVEAYVVDHLCPVGAKCLEAPAFALANIETGERVAVSAVTGEVGDPGLSEEDLSRSRSSFRWLVDAMEGK